MPLWLAFFIRVLCKLGKDLSVLLLYQLVEKYFLAFIEINSIKETADYNLQWKIESSGEKLATEAEFKTKLLHLQIK